MSDIRPLYVRYMFFICLLYVRYMSVKYPLRKFFHGSFAEKNLPYLAIQPPYIQTTSLEHIHYVKLL